MADTKVDEIDLDEEPPPLPKMTCKRGEVSSFGQNQAAFSSVGAVVASKVVRATSGR